MDRVGQLNSEEVELRLSFQIMPPAKETAVRGMTMPPMVQRQPEPEAKDHRCREKRKKEPVQVGHGMMNDEVVAQLRRDRDVGPEGNGCPCAHAYVTGPPSVFPPHDTLSAFMPGTDPFPDRRSTITCPIGMSWMCGQCGQAWNDEE
jgi:hypothetical protein